MSNGDFASGPAYGSWGSDLAHAGATRPMESLKGSMGPVFTQQPMTSDTDTVGRGGASDKAPGPAWDECFRAPMAPPTRGEGLYK